LFSVKAQTCEGLLHSYVMILDLLLLLLHVPILPILQLRG
jgi:hypothetical protein